MAKQKKQKKREKGVNGTDEKKWPQWRITNQAIYAYPLKEKYEEVLQEVVDYVETAMKLGFEFDFSTYDALSEVYGGLKNMALCRKYGLTALELRDKAFGGPPPFPHDFSTALPPPPSPETRNKNIISFSLFGGNPEQFETAVLNAMAQPAHYPNWTCRFYADETVPLHVIKRLILSRAEVVLLKDEDRVKAWPGPMWRLLALNNDLHRVVFRNADAMLTEKDALATEAWVKSGKRFHVMRDHRTHTELLLADLWGCVAGALPPLSLLTDAFFSHPVEDSRFAEQLFLRHYVWPYARLNLLHHDSVFGFFNAQPFPTDIKVDAVNANFHIGMAGGAKQFTITTGFPEGTLVYWAFFLIEGNDRTHICTYPGIICDGKVSDNIPSEYAIMMQNGAAEIRLVSGPDATV